METTHFASLLTVKRHHEHPEQAIRVRHIRSAGVPNRLTKFKVTKQYAVGPSGRAVKGVGLWPLAC